MKAALVNTAKLKDALPTELSVGSAGLSVLANLNSPELGIGFGALNAPPMSFVIWKMLTCGLVAALELEN